MHTTQNKRQDLLEDLIRREMMKRFRINATRATTNDLAFYEDLFDTSLDHDWEKKAERLQARRWRKLEQAARSQRI